MRVLMFNLLSHCESLERLLQELQDTVDSTGLTTPFPTWKEVKDLPYLDACVNEALRLQPPVCLPFERVAPRGGITLCGRYFKEGTILGMNPYVVHRHRPTFGQDADKWRPERWLHNGPEHRRMLDASLLSWVIDVLEELPAYWELLAKEIPALCHCYGASKLRDLKGWFQTGNIPADAFPLPNILLVPSAIVMQLVEYQRFAKLANVGRKHSEAYYGNTEAFGLCTGLLSALAVAQSTTQEELHQYGAVAIRLAMVVGATVDAEDTAIRFTACQSQAYASVLFDKRRGASASLLQSLHEVPGLHGRFHHVCHQEVLGRLAEFYDSGPPISLRVGCAKPEQGEQKLHILALRSILVDQSLWYEAFREIQSLILSSESSRLVCFGQERSIPPSLQQAISSRIVHPTELLVPAKACADPYQSTKISYRGCNGSVNHHAVAVVGMACEVPGATDLDEFAALLKQGKSQHVEVPSERVDFYTPWRETDSKRRWYGNFLDNYDMFDHKFFNKTAREMASTDPQHRLVLQVAYQALQQAGYFRWKDADKNIGCFIAMGLTDYEQNVACHPPNAYSATGNLRSFAAGRISHYFGWTGPALVIDTACSSSAVAVHQACQALKSGECSAALVCGVSLMTSPQWFQNLAGASFLSPTGQCKPFDAAADGYCRGEAVGAVFLKSYQNAVSHHDQILGLIAGSAVSQNRNCTPITVPNAASLSDLYRSVIEKAGLEPSSISVVEAHGTGTPVGDPAEFDSVRQVFSGQERIGRLHLGSVKGLVGHSEAAAGIVSLIKVILMMHERFIPPQSSFDTINPAIKRSANDQIEITKNLQPWTSDFYAALVNSYGASGSNASLVLTGSPVRLTETEDNGYAEAANVKYPFRIYGFDTPSLQRYVTRFRRYLSTAGQHVSVAGLAHQLALQSNPTLPYALGFSARTKEELIDKLGIIESGAQAPAAVRTDGARPVILCFGGQISRYIGLDRDIYYHIDIFRQYLDRCNAYCEKLGLGSIFPGIFQRAPVEDIVKLQTMLFALQYTCAKCWLDCGVSVAAVVGHSFGELTALCISGAIFLEDALLAIAGRARLIQEYWGADKGSMLAVEGDLAVVKELLATANATAEPSPPANIACFNAPRIFTLAGPTHSINVVFDMARGPKYASLVRAKKLEVTNAFHSALVDPLATHLQKLGQNLMFQAPKIHIERATAEAEFISPGVQSDILLNHMRNPVYFHHAAKRLAQRYPFSVWVEAGANSSITSMARQALGDLCEHSQHAFQSLNITSGAGVGFNSLVDATTSLWNEGLNIVFWGHCSTEPGRYNPLLLPPYQFAKTRNWMEITRRNIPAVGKADALASAGQNIDDVNRLWKLVISEEDGRRSARFEINSSSQVFRDYLLGHVVAQKAPLATSVLQLQIALEAVASLRSDFQDGTFLPALRGLNSHAPMLLDATRRFWVDAEAQDAGGLTWDLKVNSGASDGSGPTTKHTSGRIVFEKADDPEKLAELSRYKRVMNSTRCLSMLNAGDNDSIMQGPGIYRAFNDVVQYSPAYRGLQKIVGKGAESAGRVVMSPPEGGCIDTGLFDSFCQVAGIYLNCMTDMPEQYMFISTNIERWMRAPTLHSRERWPTSFDVHVCHEYQCDSEVLSDVFVFDAQSGDLFEVILGIRYSRILKERMRQVLHQAIPAPEGSSRLPADEPDPVKDMPHKPVVDGRGKESSQTGVWTQLQGMLCDLCGLEPDEVRQDSQLGDIGVDSLLGMELAREIESLFQCMLNQDALNEAVDVADLLRCIEETLGVKPITQNGSTEKAAASTFKVSNGDSMDSKGCQNGVEMSFGSTNTGISVNRLPRQALSAAKGSIAAVATEVFASTKEATDSFIETYGLADYLDQVLPRSTELVVAHILEALEALGCPVGAVPPGGRLPKVTYLPKHERFMNLLYGLLEKARLIEIHDKGTSLIRTANPLPSTSAEALARELFSDYPEHISDHQLTHYTGKNLSDCLVGQADILQILFGSPECRTIMTNMYSRSPVNLVWIKQMQSFLEGVWTQFRSNDGPVRIFEMGAGTGATTEAIASLIARLGIPAVYTVTDISTSFIARARKRFKQYPFMEFRAHDIEKAPPPELQNSQHVVLATNAVHATHSLSQSAASIRQFLRQDGFLVLLEETRPLPWVDLVYGLVDSWWLFDDGREHALAPPDVWKQALNKAGYRTIQWTDGSRPEASIQLSSSQYKRGNSKPHFLGSYGLSEARLISQSSELRVPPPV
ncbi:polyketide synthase [Aspergillus novofumigatus IBT 16806]|uniref:Polyketide synthase n=1 Tax=Aspergillus novofumigatus (strain IBT 16806) TaxID=1392255 RepID=A0A2I1CPQ3_ASPN1|nr:polyketide synthase [Aspergillus novofumigatus IBT 16806]PKX99601.1 polyketide synthase [Aspergillus novofumigatus IBT 16806]